MMNLSTIVPIKDEFDNLRPLHERLRAALDPLPLTYEIIVVDDGSTDGSDELLRELAAADPRVKVVQLRRNFGQTAALQAGIDHASGEILVTLDGDLQNDPADIPMLLERLDEGYDAVFGLRAKRQDSMVIRKLPSLAANWLIRKVTGATIKDLGCTLRAMRRELAEELSLYGEMHRFVAVLAQQHGARVLQVPVRHHPRVAGKTKYTLTRTVRVLLDLITVKFLYGYMTRPMHVMGLAGLVSMGLGALSLAVPIYNKLSPENISIIRSPMLLLSVMLELIGVQFLSMGLLGDVMSRTYFESQGKKAYTVRRTLNIEREEPRRAA
jgi:glycosyltransferase involved in cell wall biosynthesis